ncbi:MAG: DUF3883 domain-containing protein [Balneolaceae bacterium]
MNSQRVRDILKRYKANFAKIHNQEIYKWQAVKQFQDTWSIGTKNFSEMLKTSLSKTENLLGSGNYFPRRMIIKNAEKTPNDVRNLFNWLYDEEKDPILRIEKFQNDIKSLNDINFPGTNSYQDHRAISVYLSLRFPDSYYLYKYTLFKKFASLIDYPYVPKIGALENITHYFSMCELVKEEIRKDNELLKLHKNRIQEEEYFDSSFNILTQDVLYAIIHFEVEKKTTKQGSVSDRLVKTDEPISSRTEHVNLRGSFTNHIERDRENKRIGELGELLVMQYEKERLKKLGIKKNPIHVSKSKGDGLGYDILSFNEDGEEFFIEVKTTVQGISTPFYITKNELIRSELHSRKFFLYRVFDFDDQRNTGKYSVIKGSLSDLCNNPVLFKVNSKQ